MMDIHTFEENWASICRKFPLVCVLSLNDRKAEDVREAIKSHSIQFDHVIVLSDSIIQQDMASFFQKERIINVTLAKGSDLHGSTDLDKVKSYVRSNVIIVSSSLEILNGNVRWSVYDKIKEMKSPTNDRVFLDENMNYCKNEEAKLTATLRLV